MLPCEQTALNGSIDNFTPGNVTAASGAVRNASILFGLGGILLVSVVVVLLVRNMLTSLDDCLQFSEVVAGGDLEHVLTVERSDELGRLAQSLRVMVLSLRETIELSLEEHVPISASDAIFDFKVLSRTDSGDAEVAVTAAPRTIIDMYTDVFSAAGMTLLSVELEAEALARTLIHPDDASTHLIVDFGELRTGIAIVSNGEVQFTSTVTIGGRMLTETLAKHFNVSNEEAEGMKKELGIKRTTTDEELFGLLLNNVAVLRDEVNKNFMYWHTHPDEHGKARPVIESILLVGGDANLAGLSDYLTSSLRVKTTVSDVWVNAGLPEGEIPEISRTASLGYATALGLALRTTDHE